MSWIRTWSPSLREACSFLSISIRFNKDALFTWYSKRTILYQPSGSMKLVCNFLQTVFYRQSSSNVFETDTYCLEVFVGTILA